MSDDYTPTTEAVRESYALSGSRLTGRRLAAFDRWLTAHDAQVKAEALEEFAAEVYESWEGGHGYEGLARTEVEDELRARAAEYRSGART